MNYTLTHETKARAQKRHIKSLSINYGISILVFGYVLYINWDDPTIRITCILCIIFLPLIALFQIKNVKKKLSTEYEITDSDLLIKEGNSIKNKIPFSSIQSLATAKNGYEIKLKSGNIFISDQIENKDELWKELNRKASW